MSLSLALLITSLLLIYFAIWQGLKPLAKLQSGFEVLESNRLDIRIDEQAVSELSQLHNSFNHMISFLQKITHEKQELSRKLITPQKTNVTILPVKYMTKLAPMFLVFG